MIGTIVSDTGNRRKAMTFYITPRRYTLTRRWAGENARGAEFTLPVDVREEDAAYTISAIVPGLKAEDITIQILDDVLTIEGARPDEDAAYVLRELPYGTFHRSLRLPVPVDADAAEASVAEGVLTLRIPKAETALPKAIKVMSK
jgi:HSP20 family protein